MSLPSPTIAKKRVMKPVRTMEDFVLQWDSKLEKIIRSFKLQEYTEDLKQEIYMRIHDNKGLESYDPAISSFSTYIYAVVLTIIYNFRKQYLRERNTMPVSFDEVFWDESRQDSPERNVFSLPQIASLKVDEEKGRIFKLQVGSVRKALSRLPVRSAFYQNGEVMTRDLATLFDMIMEGKSREEMCTRFDYSTGSVGILFDELRKVPEVQELKDLMTGG